MKDELLICLAFDLFVLHFDPSSRRNEIFLALCALRAVIELSLVFDFVEYSHIQYGLSLIIAVCVTSLDNFMLNKKIRLDMVIMQAMGVFCLSVLVQRYIQN